MSSSGNVTAIDEKVTESPSDSADTSLLGPWLTLPILSQCCGVAYLFAWSAMYYPQLYLNYKRKSVQGFSLDLWLYNLSGFLGYAVYNCYRAYMQMAFDLPRAVKTHDVVFSVHGLICNILIGLQIYFYERGGQMISKWTWVFVIIACAVFLYLSFLAWLQLLPWDSLMNTDGSTALITPIQFLGTIKVIITFVKYIPQIIMNHRRKSTAGLAIQVPMMDIAGALFSGLQNILDAIYQSDIHIVTGNLPKMLIGTASSLYGFIILFQHYVLYRASSRYEPVSEVELGSLDKQGRPAVKVYQGP
ncbi:Cystinosin, putative, partial [Perkinsus marinus ATCC 50983]